MSKGMLVLVGVGNIGGVHAETMFREMSEEGLYKGYKVGICSSRPEVKDGDLSGAQGNNLNVKVRKKIDDNLLQHITFFTTPDEVLAHPQVKAVMLCCDTAQHCALAEKFLNKGIAVLIEKPFGMSTEEVAKVMSNANRALICIGHILPFFPQFAALIQSKRDHHYEHLVCGQMWRTVTSTNDINKPSNKAKVRSAVFDLIVHDGHLAALLHGKPDRAEILEKTIHPEDQAFLSYVKVRLYWGDDYVDIESGALGDCPFKHGYELEYPEADVVFDADRYNGVPTVVGRSDCGNEQTSILPLPASDADPDIAAFALEHREFLALLDAGNFNKGESYINSPLNAYAAMTAVTIAEQIEKAAVGGENSLRFEYVDLNN